MNSTHIEYKGHEIIVVEANGKYYWKLASGIGVPHMFYTSEDRAIADAKDYVDGAEARWNFFFDVAKNRKH